MNIWHPAKNEAEATAWFRMTGAMKSADIPIAALVRTGWTIPAAVDYGYIELMPGAPEHLRILPMPPMMPASDMLKTLAPAWSFGTAKEPSEITKEVVRQIVDRDNHGQKKYGVTLDRDDLSLSDWLQHMAEELMDGAHYALAAKRVHDQYEVEVLQLVANAALSVRNPYTGRNADREVAFSQGVTDLVRAIKQELSK